MVLLVSWRGFLPVVNDFVGPARPVSLLALTRSSHGSVGSGLAVDFRMRIIGKNKSNSSFTQTLTR